MRILIFTTSFLNKVALSDAGCGKFYFAFYLFCRSFNRKPHIKNRFLCFCKW